MCIVVIISCVCVCCVIGLVVYVWRCLFRCIKGVGCRRWCCVFAVLYVHLLIFCMCFLVIILLCVCVCLVICVVLYLCVCCVLVYDAFCCGVLSCVCFVTCAFADVFLRVC